MASATIFFAWVEFLGLQMPDMENVRIILLLESNTKAVTPYGMIISHGSFEFFRYKHNLSGECL